MAAACRLMVVAEEWYGKQNPLAQSAPIGRAALALRATRLGVGLLPGGVVTGFGCVFRVLVVPRLPDFRLSSRLAQLQP